MKSSYNNGVMPHQYLSALSSVINCLREFFHPYSSSCCCVHTGPVLLTTRPRLAFCPYPGSDTGAALPINRVRHNY